MVAAFASVPFVIALGMVVDYDRMARGRAGVQQALDAATLASAATGKLDSVLSTSVFNANFSNPEATVSNLSFSTSGENIVGTAKVSITTTFSAIIGVQTLEIAATSKAVPVPQVLASATFKSVSAQGAYSKDVFLFTRGANGAINSQSTVLTYRYTYKNGVGTKTLTPSAGVTKTITVGPYETYGVGLVIYEDLTYTGKLVNPITKYSDAANASTWIRTTGSCNTSGGATSNVEDGGDTNFLDFVYNMTCTIGPSKTHKPRLSS
ncbi:MAG: pilus assembly protein TadG-related protein [Siculibacillus sp.]|nr:pilus assembly protein TadG-related protein [Siculibacillus sp.]